MTDDRWMPVVGFEGFYEVSDTGKVRSLRHMTKQGVRGGRVLTPHVGPKGYLTVGLTATALGRRETRYVHELVLEAFVGPRPTGMDACHDPDPTRSNCHLANLRWDTRRSNFADKRAHGTQTFGSAHPSSKLTEAQVLEILSLRGTMSQKAIGMRFGVSNSQVHLIHTGQQWKHLERAQ